MLTRTLEVSDFCKKFFSSLIWLRLIKEHDKSSFLQISPIFVIHQQVYFQRVFRNRTFYRIYVTMFFRANNFRNNQAMTLYFFSYYSKFNVDSKTAIKKYKTFSIFQIIASEFVAANSPYNYDNTRSWQSRCYQLNFSQIDKRPDKSAFLQFSAILGTG